MNGYAQEMPKRESPTEELLRLRAENTIQKAQLHEYALGVREVKHDLALAENEASFYREMSEVKDEPWYMRFAKSTVMDVVYFVLGVWLGIKAADA